MIGVGPAAWSLCGSIPSGQKAPDSATIQSSARGSAFGLTSMAALNLLGRKTYRLFSLAANEVKYVNATHSPCCGIAKLTTAYRLVRNAQLYNFIRVKL